MPFAIGNMVPPSIIKIYRLLSAKNMSSNKELEKRIETLEKEVQHLKAILQYQIRNKKKSDS